MHEQVVLYAVVEGKKRCCIHALCGTDEDAERARDEILAAANEAGDPGRFAEGLNVVAINAVFTGDRYRLVFGTPLSRPDHPLEVPAFQSDKAVEIDVREGDSPIFAEHHEKLDQSPDKLYIYRKEALAAAARYNYRQLLCGADEPLDWAVVVEIGELQSGHPVECQLCQGIGWEVAELIRPVRVIHPTPEEAALPEQEIPKDA
jgi:hypothetical protein